MLCSGGRELFFLQLKQKGSLSPLCTPPPLREPGYNYVAALKERGGRWRRHMYKLQGEGNQRG